MSKCFEANKKVHTAMWTSKNKLHTNYITGGLNMNNLSQAELNAVQQMDDNNLKDHLDQEDENDEQSGD